MWGQRLTVGGVLLASVLGAGALELLTPRGADCGIQRGGNGDSGAAFFSADGRFVLFSSLADNLVSTTNAGPGSVLKAPHLNVYLRDRVRQSTTLVSVQASGSGGGGNGDSMASGLSADGRYALFESSASDLVANDTNAAGDVFVRDLVAGTTIMVSAALNGSGGNGASHSAVLTADGRYVAFVSAATNLVAGDTNGIADVFVRDLQRASTELISVGALSPSEALAEVGSAAPALSADGRYVAFYSTATNLVAGTIASGDVYVRDRSLGTTIEASSSAAALLQSLCGLSNAVSYGPLLSSNAEYVIFGTGSAVTNWDVAASARSCGLLCRYGLQSGALELISTSAVMDAAANWGEARQWDMTPDGRYVAFLATNQLAFGTQSVVSVQLWDGNSASAQPVSLTGAGELSTAPLSGCPRLDDSGRYVAFLSRGGDLTSGSLRGGLHLFVRDLALGTNVLVDLDSSGAGCGVSPAGGAVLSHDGQLAAFEHREGGVVDGALNRVQDLYVRDLRAAATEMISVHDAAGAISGADGCCLYPSLNADAGYVAFCSEADDLVANDTNHCTDVFVRDRSAATTLLASAALNGAAGSAGSTLYCYPLSAAASPVLSADGRWVLFSSLATNLVAGMTNTTMQVYVRDLAAGSTCLVSVSTNGGAANMDSWAQSLSADGRFVLFRSKANNLTAQSLNTNYWNGFLRDLSTGTTVFLTDTNALPGIPASSFCLSMAPQSGRIAIGCQRAAYSYEVFRIWDPVAGRMLATNTVGSYNVPQAVQLSPDGTRLAWTEFDSSSSAFRLYVMTLSNTNAVQVEPNASANAFDLQFSTNSQFLAYLTASGCARLFDCVAQTNVRVGYRYDSTQETTGVVSRIALSSSGRYVAYCSAVPDVVPGDGNEAGDVFLFDRLTGQTSLCSGSANGLWSGNGPSALPVFSADESGGVLCSWASDLSARANSRTAQLFLLPGLASAFGTGTNGGSPGATNPPASFEVRPLAAGIAGQPFGLSWPAAQGCNYQIQYKNSLSETNWQTLNCSVSVVEGIACAADLAPASGQRFYRVVIVP